MKILYAAANREGSQIQLSRFLSSIQDKSWIVKVAAYSKSSPPFQSIDWNLDSMLSIFDPYVISFNNDNLSIYYDQVKHFNPDLIISDLEPFTSYVANLAGIRIWQVSPSLLYYATSHIDKIRLGIYKSYRYIFAKSMLEQQRIKNFIFNSDRNLIYSHFGDVGLEIPAEFEWVRPEHSKGKVSKACEHNLVAGLIHNDKSVLNFIRRYDDAVVFSNFTDESYSDLKLKSIQDQQEYACNVKNCSRLVSMGHADLLADAYYNEKFVSILPNFAEPECIINSLYSERFGTGSICYDRKALDQPPQFLKINYNKSITSLVEKVAEI